MKNDRAYEITRQVLEDAYPEQLAFFDDWLEQKTKPGRSGEFGTGATFHTGLIIPDVILAIVEAVLANQALSATIGVLSGIAANVITDLYSPKKPLDDADIDRIVEALKKSLDNHPPDSPS